MPAPIVLISNQRIKPDMLETYKSNYARAVERFISGWPRTLAHAAYLGEDAAQVSVVMAFADAEAMEAHLRGLGDAPRRAQESMDFISLQIYGSPTEAALDLIRTRIAPGVPMTIMPAAIAGYIRGGPNAPQ